MSRPPRILILSASIGEGHDLPARVLADGLIAEAPGAEVEIVDALATVGGFVERTVLGGSHFESKWGGRFFDLEFKLITDVRPTRWFAGKVMIGLSSGPILRRVEEAAPDVVVSTYPGATEVLGRAKARGRLQLPLVSAITDLTALRYWAHPAIDLHLITHPESEPEVREIAPRSEIACVRGLTRPEFYEPRDRAEARRSLDLPEEGRVVVVSGGGWAVGDLTGAAEAALAQPDTTVVCLCGRNEEVRLALVDRFAAEQRVVVMGFSDRIDDLFAAADVLVHSTAGLTVLEALMRGCRVISYGWGHGHIRVNNAAYRRLGLAEVAADRAELDLALSRALAQAAPDDQAAWFAGLPSAAGKVLALLPGR
ncbi:MAG: processive 1,2-diacylglycerol beta-glucosyltransferase [Solirubrobacterales bacterium]|nr:processive 1,2-diacylglycerol beta-glucosyltransferase [Solirubrobacterales bacterium]